MSTLQYRGSLVWALVLMSLLASRSADAQVVAAPGTPLQPGGLYNDVITGVEYDRLNQAKAERRLPQVQAKLRRDTERGNVASAAHDARWIDNLRYRIAVDRWLIRQNSLQDPGYYPVRNDPISCAAIAEAARPSEIPDPARPTPAPMAAVPTVSITIVNSAAAGTDITFVIDDITQKAVGGSRQDLVVTPEAVISYDGGGSIGQRRYQISSGVYEFRSTAEGWVLYKL